MKRSLLLLLFFSVFMVSGCRFKKPFFRKTNKAPSSSLNLPERWTSEPLEEEKIQRSHEGWLSHFKDPLLPPLILEALKNNHNLLSLKAQVDSLRAETLIARASRYPELSGNFTASRGERSGINFGVSRFTTELFSADLEVSWEIDLWQRMRNAHYAASTDEKAKERDYQAARLSLGSRIGKIWFEAIEGKLQWQLAKNTEKSFSRHLEILNERFEKGLTSALDVRLLRSQKASALGRAHARERQFIETVRTLEVLLGRYPSGSLIVSDTLPVLLNSVERGLPSELLLRRPDILAKKQALKASSLRVLESKKGLLPRFLITGNGGSTAGALSDLFQENSKEWGLSSRVSQPLYQGGRIQGRIERAKAGKRGLLEQYYRTVLEAFREVEGALSNERFLKQEGEALKTMQEESLGALEQAWERYGRGLANMTTVLETERRVFEAKRENLQIHALQLKNRMDLYLALGGGMES